MSAIIGIDLGTTHTVVAQLTEAGPQVIGDGDGALIPSAVAVDDTGTLLVGEAALARLQHTPGAGVRWFKRDMGSTRTWTLGDHELGATELSALVLREARERAEAALGESVSRAVITVPAYFQEPQRAATAEAGQLAGLEVVRMVNEPTAAALAHGLSDTATERLIVVIDLGGGTFDVTLLEVFEGIFEVRATGGDSRLGGEDLTDALAERFREKVSASDAALRAAAEEAKRALSTADAALLSTGSTTPVPVSLADLRDVSAPLVERMRRCITDTLGTARLTASDIDEVVLAGGATRSRPVRELVGELFSAEVAVADPDRIVALGAAVQAGLVIQDKAVSDVIVTDVLSHSLGVHVVRRGEDRMLEGYFTPVLHRNTTLPVRRVERFHTVHPKQSSITVKVFQGEHRYTRENRFLGEFEVSGFPPLEEEEGGQPVDIAFTHTLDGLLEVEATVVATGEKARLLVEGHAGRLTDEARARAEEALKALKVHPRDLLPNRLLLEQALARHERLEPRARELLDGPLTAFEDALERQHPEAIEEAARALRIALAHPALSPMRSPDAPD